MKGMRTSISVAVAGLMLMAGCASRTAAPDTTIEDEPVAATSTTVAPTTTTSEQPVDVVVGSPADGFAAVDQALSDAMGRWESNGPSTYGYRVTVDDGTGNPEVTWVRVFDPDWHEDIEWDVPDLFTLIASTVTEPPRDR